jgi:hypothetical protein
MFDSNRVSLWEIDFDKPEREQVRVAFLGELSGLRKEPGLPKNCKTIGDNLVITGTGASIIQTDIIESTLSLPTSSDVALSKGIYNIIELDEENKLAFVGNNIPFNSDNVLEVVYKLIVDASVYEPPTRYRIKGLVSAIGIRKGEKNIIVSTDSTGVDSVRYVFDYGSDQVNFSIEE